MGQGGEVTKGEGCRRGSETGYLQPVVDLVGHYMPFTLNERDTVGGSKAAERHDVILFYQYDSGLVF